MEKNNSLVKAINKNVRTSPRKLALVCNFIKGKKADVALRDLEFSRKRIAKEVLSLIHISSPRDLSTSRMPSSA